MSEFEKHIKEAIYAAECGETEGVKTYVGLLGHKSFACKKIVFDLSKCAMPYATRDMLEEAVSEMDGAFRQRVSFIMDDE